MIINDNYVIERSYCKRITNLKTGWIIDDKEQLVAITQNNYQKELIENLVDEETFKSLSNINYIPNLHWKDLKKLIFDLIGDISDNEVLLRDDFNLIEEYITKFGIEQTQKLLQDTDKQLNDDIKRLETEYQTLINTKEKYVASEEENKQLLARKELIEKELYVNQEKQNKLNKELEEYRNKKQLINNLNEEIIRLNNSIEFNQTNIEDYKKLYEQNNYDVELLRQNDINKINNEINDLELHINSFQSQLDEEKTMLEIFKNQGNELKQKEIKVENSTCNACGQTLPEEKIQETLNKLKELHNIELNNLKEKYDLSKQRVVDLENELIASKKDLEKRNKEFEEIKTKEYEVIDETDKQKQIRVAKEEKELANIELRKQLEIKFNEFKILEEEFSKLEQPNIEIEDNLPLRLELDDINNKLATTITLNNISEDIDNTLKELNTKKDNKIINKDKMQQVIKFNNIKADLLQTKVRNYFKICNFRTKEYTLTGDEVETFKLENERGILFNETNNGDKIALGLDLLCGIMNLKEIYCPILVDNSESYSGDFNVDKTQLIITIVVKNQERLEIK
jgi:hypothetical protein